MQSTGETLLRAIRRPEYTGRNRCLPCTLANLAIAGVLAGAASLVSAWAAVGVLAVSLAAISLRGYLVPGTPTLTKRYLPDRVLRYFDAPHGPAGSGDPDVDLEAALVHGGVLVPCEGVDDLCLADSVRDRWRDEIATKRDGDRAQRALATHLGVDPDRVTTGHAGTAFVAAVDGDPVGRWASDAAFVADVAGFGVLADQYPDWAGVDSGVRWGLVAALRLFLETCPACDGPVTLDTAVVESCCRSVDVVAVTCDDCGARLFEVEQPEATTTATAD